MFRINYDALGIGISVACAIHCAILPLIITALPVFGVNLIDHRGFESGMIGLAALVGLGSLWHGYRKHHRQAWPALLFVTGILMLLSKLITEAHSILILLIAVGFIISAHLFNYRLCRKTRHSHSTSCSHR